MKFLPCCLFVVTIVKIVHKWRSSCFKIAHISSILRPWRVHLTVFRNSAANWRDMFFVNLLEVGKLYVGVVSENNVVLLFLVVFLDLNRVLQKMSVQLFWVEMTINFNLSLFLTHF